MPNSITEVISLLMEHLHAKSVSELGRKMNWHKSVAIAYANGTRIPDGKRINEIADILGLNRDRLHVLAQADRLKKQGDNEAAEALYRVVELSWE